ncbi:hypothetical protein THRCLA_20346 [Thraustotheca clavata]|uniref:RING-type domain-containing protein n=1 Tax=Thraustotheca clavata TaxID=74557 RepID=A0A1W0A8M8_9STRA|nr:hypothetical protein THRCLA_20346 [Thraustotheca clavata]
MTLLELYHDIALQNDESLDRLKTAQENDMKQVKVHSTAMNVAFCGSGTFTIYTLVATCPGTKTWWMLKKRYSQFFNLRKKLLYLHAQSKFPEITDLLQDVVDAEFPKKHMMVSVNNKSIIKERKNQLQKFTTKLIIVRAKCILTTIEHANADDLQTLLDTIYDLLEDFLEIPHPPSCDDDGDADEEDNNNSLTSMSSPELEPSSEDDEDSKTIEKPICTICTCPLELESTFHTRQIVKKVRFDIEDDDFAEEKILQLPCSHRFHEECVIHWVEQKNACPVCHAQAFDGVMALSSTSLAIKAPLFSKDNRSLLKKTKQREAHVHFRAINVMAPTKDKLDGSEAYTLYLIIAACPDTKCWWLVHKRYSQFHALRKELIHLHRKCKSNGLLKPLAALLNPTVMMEFPRKHIMLTYENPVIIQERKYLLNLFTVSLINLRSACMAASMDETKYTNPHLFDKLINLSQIISSFLKAPEILGQHNCIKPIQTASSECSICLETSENPTKLSFIMPCGHSFHEMCLLKWFESCLSCPMCRAQATQGALV